MYPAINNDDQIPSHNYCSHGNAMFVRGEIYYSSHKISFYIYGHYLPIGNFISSIKNIISGCTALILYTLYQFVSLLIYRNNFLVLFPDRKDL
jgi:hypothetical protein